MIAYYEPIVSVAKSANDIFIAKKPLDAAEAISAHEAGQYHQVHGMMRDLMVDIEQDAVGTEMMHA